MDDATQGTAFDLARVFVRLAQHVAEEHRPEEILRAVGDLCTELLPVHGAGVLLREDGALAVGTANTSEGRAVEELEAELGEGPCSEAVRTGDQVVAADLERMADRYPRFVPRALEVGIRGIHALPMSSRTGLVGALDLVSREPMRLTPGQMDVGQLIADAAVVYLANSLSHQEATRLTRQLQHALDSRVVIEQAKGKLAARSGEPVEAAFERMRRYARHHQLQLRTVAERILQDELAP